MRIRRYGRSCEGVLSECVRFAMLPMGRDDHDLRRHLLARVDWVTKCLFVREEVRSIITAGDTPTGSAPMVLLDRLDRVMKDEFDAKMLGSVGSDQLAEAKFFKRTVDWYEQQMCSSWAGVARCVTELAVVSGRTDPQTVENTRTLEAFRTVIVLNGSDGLGAAKAARVARLDAHDAAGHFLDGTR